MFGSYSFAQSHAASFALITYWHAWLRTYHPAAFFCGILRNMPMGFYPIASVMADAQRAGVKLLHPDINRSEVLPVLELQSVAQPAIRLGLASVDGIGEEIARGIVATRGERAFANLGDFIARTEIDRRVAEQLILAGALDALHTQRSDNPRRQLIWDLVAAFEQRGKPRLSLRDADEPVQLKAFTQQETLEHEFGLLRGIVSGHLMDLRAEQYAALKCTPSILLKTMKDGSVVRVGGVNSVRQRPPTAKGVCFLGLDEPTGMINVIVPKAIYERDRAATRAAFVVVDGRVQLGMGGAVNVVAERVRAV